MGMFKSIRDLQKQGNEIQKNQDVGAQMSDAQSRLAGATEMMAQQTAAANAAAKAATSGVDASATIVAIRQTGPMVNFQPAVELDLTVMPEGLPPYPVTVQQVIQQVQLPLAQPGKTVQVKVDPEDPAAVWIDWSRVT
ncbi:MAG: hypothetical protein WDZ37_02030 [Solirubrobacterales bacterium]